MVYEPRVLWSQASGIDIGNRKELLLKKYLLDNTGNQTNYPDEIVREYFRQIQTVSKHHQEELLSHGRLAIAVLFNRGKTETLDFYILSDPLEQNSNVVMRRAQGDMSKLIIPEEAYPVEFTIFVKENELRKACLRPNGGGLERYMTSFPALGQDLTNSAAGGTEFRR